MLNIIKEVNSEIKDSIKIFEEFLGIKLPKDYRSFLESTNGGIPLKRYFFLKNFSDEGSIISSLFGITEDDQNSLMKYYRECKDIAPPEMIPIGNDQGGNIILLSIKGKTFGKVYFLDHEKPINLIADSFEEFINSLKSDDEIASS